MIERLLDLVLEPLVPDRPAELRVFVDLVQVGEALGSGSRGDTRVNVR